jgi:hypothetical protein
LQATPGLKAHLTEEVHYLTLEVMTLATLIFTHTHTADALKHNGGSRDPHQERVKEVVPHHRKELPSRDKSSHIQHNLGWQAPAHKIDSRYQVPQDDPLDATYRGLSFIPP